MRSYEAARNLFSFLGLCSWAVIVIGAILAFSGGTIAGTGFGRGANGMSALLGAAPGSILAMLGFYGLALVQMGRASVDSAEYGQQSLDVARQQLEVSREVLDQGKKTAASYASLVASNQPRSKKKAKDSASDSSEISYASKAKSEPKKEPPADAIPAQPEPKKAVAHLKASEPKAVLASKKPEPKKEPFVSKQIEEKDGVFSYGSTTFSSEAAARRYVAQLGVNPNVKLPDA